MIFLRVTCANTGVAKLRAFYRDLFFSKAPQSN